MPIRQSLKTRFSAVGFFPMCLEKFKVKVRYIWLRENALSAYNKQRPSKRHFGPLHSKVTLKTSNQTLFLNEVNFICKMNDIFIDTVLSCELDSVSSKPMNLNGNLTILFNSF